MKTVKNIASKSEDITQWYTDVCMKAELMDYASTKGFIVYRPDGYSLWEEIKNYLDKRFKDLGVRNVYLPSLIPMSLLNKEKDHIKGFAPECAVITRGGNKTLQEEMVVRPTSETLFCDHFKDILHSYNELPILYNQWCSVVRWEKTTRPFLRGSEFLWQEGHTLHKDENEARAFALSVLRIYSELGRNLLAIPFVIGEKSASEKFAGAVSTYCIEALMPDGQALQCGTTHYLGTGFSKAYDIKYTNKDNQIEYPHYTSWGVSTRLLGALIMVHGDDNGLVLPPKVAPTQVVIIPVKAESDPNILKTCKELYETLKKDNIRVILDDSNKTPGWKFSQYEMKGVPLRIEIGPKDIFNSSCMASIRYSYEKKILPLENISKTVSDLLNDIQEKMYQKANELLTSKIFECHNREEIDKVLKNHEGFAKIISSEDEAEDEQYMKEKYSATPRVIPFNQIMFQEEDSITGKKGKKVIYYARAY